MMISYLYKSQSGESIYETIDITIAFIILFEPNESTLL